MKIVYYSDPSLADTDFPLVRALQRAGHEVHFFVLIASYCMHRTVIDIDRMLPENDILPAVAYPAFEKFTSFMDMSKVYAVNKVHKKDVHPQSQWLYIKLCRKIAKINPDMMICTNPPGFGTLQFLQFRKRLMFIIHDPFPHTGETSFRKTFFRNICFKLGRRFVLLNSEQLDEFMATYHIPRERILVNRLGVYDVFRVFGDSKAVEKRDKKNVLFFGRISPYKGIQYLCEAMERVHEAVPDATLTIAGNGKMYFDISPYEAHDYITVLNRFITKEEIATMLNRCAFTVCPYTDATQSGVIMTSYAFETPVLATTVGGLVSQIEDGVTGVLIPPKNVNALADAMIRLLQNSDTLDTMQANIHKKYCEESSEFSWAAIAKKYVEFGKIKV